MFQLFAYCCNSEYNTAIHRAHLTADWKQFEAEKDVLPNLEWMESTSVERRLTHIPFYGLVLPVEHEFWSKIKPGDEWGCKCDLAATDAERTPEELIPPYGDYKPSKGLDNNPAKDGKLFNDTHPYFPSKCDKCKLNTQKNKQIKGFFNKKTKDCYDCFDITANLRLLHNQTGKDYNETLKDICSMNIFKQLPNNKGIFGIGNNSDPDFERLLKAAQRAVEFGKEVYILPNPKDIRTPDFIFKKKNIYKDYDLKTIMGNNSADNRLLGSQGQSRRALLYMATDSYKPRKLALDIKKYFERSSEALEVLIFKGKREIVVTKLCCMSKQFVRNFMKKWK